MDTGASSHLNDYVYSLSDVFNMCIYPSVSVGDGYSIPVTNSDHSVLPTPHRPFHLNNVLITPNIVKNLIYVRQFVRDNNCTIEFDAFSFFVKDIMTRRLLLCCDSTGDLYPVMTPSTIPHAFLTKSSNIISNSIRSSPISTNTPHTTLVDVASTNVPIHKEPINIAPTDAKPINTAQQPTNHELLNSAANDTVPTQTEPATPQPTSVFVYQIQPTQNVNPNSVSIHPKVTCFHVGTNRPTQRLNLHVSSVSPLPKSYTYAFNDPNWQNAMCDEYNELIKINTWTLVPRPMDANIVRCMWLFHHKYLADGTFSRYKARLVVNGSTQVKGIDFDETFSPVVKPSTIRTVLSWLLLDISRFISPECFLAWMFLSRRKYAAEILERAHMANCNPIRTPVDTESNLGEDGDPVSDLTFYRSLAEAEYRGVANVVAETCWLRNLLRELHTPLSSTTFVYCDNVSAVYLSTNLVQHQRTKHIKIDIHFVRDLVVAGEARLVWRDLFAEVSHSSAVVAVDELSLFVGCVSDFWRGIVEAIVCAMHSIMSCGVSL
ncbi:ribonuclease H-like domain-containing protein [Tanacetum coccineum]